MQGEPVWYDPFSPAGLHLFVMHCFMRETLDRLVAEDASTEDGRYVVDVGYVVEFFDFVSLHGRRRQRWLFGAAGFPAEEAEGQEQAEQEPAGHYRQALPAQDGALVQHSHRFGGGESPAEQGCEMFEGQDVA